MATFKELHPKEWAKLYTKGFGYVCPECGNKENFRQYYHLVKNVTCDTNDGRIIYSEIEKLDAILAPTIVGVECVDCGGDAIICEKGVVVDVCDHDGGVGV